MGGIVGGAGEREAGPDPDGVEAYERATGKVPIEALRPGALSRDLGRSRIQAAVSTFLSVLAAAVGVLLLAPLFMIIGTAIVLDSPGPVFFLQECVGLRGRHFKLLKFRTMRPARRTTSEWEPDNGYHVTRLGRWLRRFRLDELPQLINVLRGDMAIVGPRPHPVSDYRLFNRKIPYCFLRSSVRPGITGWAQVRHGWANSLEEETETMRYDLYYIKHRSVRLDLRVVLETAVAVLLGRGVAPARRNVPVPQRPVPQWVPAPRSRAAMGMGGDR